MLAVLLTLCLMLSLSTSVFAAKDNAAGTEAAAVSAMESRFTPEAAAELLRAAREEAGLVQGDLAALDPDTEIRVMVETDGLTAVEIAGGVAYTAAAQTAETNALRRQADVSAQVEALTGNTVLNRSAYLVNTFTINARVGQLRDIAALPGVVSVSPVTTYQLKMSHAIDMTTATRLWEEMGYRGEGTVIAIVDSGVNYAHPDMALDDGVDMKITEEDARALIAELGYGTYYSDKVPFAYSYPGFYEIDNTWTTHGLHVSGIAAGNGEILGVAPNAQLLALQVFGSSGSAYTDDIIRAVEDAVKLDADIVNLSLGSTAGFYDDVDHLQRALQTATDAGVLCCVAAGNDGTSASLLGLNTNDFGVVDTGSVSSPATAPDVLAVASVQNEYLLGNILTLTDADQGVHQSTAFNFSSVYETFHSNDPMSTGWENFQDVYLVDCGLGTEDELYTDEMMDLVIFNYMMNGIEWVGLVERGDISFSEKIQNVIGLGASGVIIYNNAATNDVPMNVSAEEASTMFFTRHALMVSGNFGAELLTLAEAGTSVSFDPLEQKFILASDGGTMSTFSSWGPTPTLDIKPEISAPGGNIYSISSGTGYEVMSGTSMATPYVSGASALVLQAVKAAEADGKLKLGDLNYAEFVKLALMNTADPIVDEDGVPYSVRQQGAGMVDPAGAAFNSVLATVDGLADAALGSIGSSESFTVTLTNYGTEAQTYTVSASDVLTDYTLDDGTYGVEIAAGCSFSFSANTVTVPAGGSTDITVTLTAGGAQRDHFVEGFLRFANADGEDIGLPVLAFHGDWYAAENIIDAPSWEEDNIIGTACDWPSTMVAMGGGYIAGYNSLGEFETDAISFSPNGDDMMDDTYPILGMLRSAETVKIEVTDEDGNVIRLLQTATQLPKVLGVDAGGQYRQTFKQLADYELAVGAWDGTVYNPRTGAYELCDEGQYYLRVTVTMPGSDTEEVLDLPVKLDVTAPEAEIQAVSANTVQETIDEPWLDEPITYDVTQVTVLFTAEDNVDTYDNFVFYINGSTFEVTKDDCEYDDAAGTYTAQINGALFYEDDMNEIGLYVEDYCANGTILYKYLDADETAPVLFTTLTNTEDSWYDSFYLVDNYADVVQFFTPEEIAQLNLTHEIRGVVGAGVAQLTIDGEDVELIDGSHFLCTVPLQFGENEYRVVARDAEGAVLFDQMKLVYCSDGSSIGIRIYPAVYLEGDEAFREMVPATFRPASQWTDQVFSMTSFLQCFGYYTLYQEVVPMVIEVDDQVESVSFFYFDPAYEVDADADAMAFELPPLEGQHYLYQTVTMDDFEYDEDLGVYLAYFDLPMARRDTTMYYDGIDPADYETRFSECYFTTVDMMGQVTYSMVRTMNRDTTVLARDFDPWGEGLDDFNILDNPNSIVAANAGFTIHPLDDMYEAGNFPFILTPDDLDENGFLHVYGELLLEDESIPAVLYANGGAVAGTDIGMDYDFNIKIFPGVNYMTLSVDYDGWISGYTYLLYYLPEPTTVTFDDSRIADGAVITTTEDTFEISGAVTSYYMGESVTINGDNVLYDAGPLSNPAGEVQTWTFAYTAELELGTNIITVEATNSTWAEDAITFTVIRSAVSAPAGDDTGDDNGDDTGTTEPGFLFDDVQDENTYFFTPVYWAVEQGITNGTSETTFSPDDNCTRGQIVTFLYRAAGEPEVTTANNPFTDVVAGSYYEKAVLWAVEQGITKGTSETTFSPDDICTRAQIVTFLYRAFGEPAVTAAANFTDVAADAYYANAVAWAVAEDITTGTSDSTFSPDAFCIRAQAVTFLYRAYAK